MIREITLSDFENFWPTFSEIIEAQETYAFVPSMNFKQAYELWCVTPLKTFVFEDHHQITGSYYIKPNGMGPSKHICNCGYMVSTESRGNGIARKLCKHSQQVARELGFKAMQFNSVVSTNEPAISLWKKLAYNIVGTIPNAYLHKQLGYVDTYIMYKQL
jgi:GNAT superfamily N-acetyltransferase